MKWILISIGAVVVILALSGAVMILWDWLKERKKRK